jgi:hypothetical protein
MKLPSLKILRLSAICTGMLAASTHAAVLVNDNFSLSSGSNVGSVSNAESAGVGTYTTIQGSLGMTVTTISGFGTGNVLSFGNNTNTYYRSFDGAATVTLSGLAIGESLTMTYDVRFDGGTFAAAQNFSFGFVNQASPNSILYANVNLNAGQSEFRERSGSFNMSDAGIQVGAAWTQSATVSTTSYSYGLSVTNQGGNNFLVSYTLNGVALSGSSQTLTASQLGLEGTTITGIAFRHSQTPGVVTYIDNVYVATVPEPAAALLAIGGLGFLMVGFRRRRLGAF